MAVHRPQRDAAQAFGVDCFEILVKALGHGQQFQPAQGLRHQPLLHQGPAPVVGGQGGAAGILNVEQIDHGQIGLGIPDRPVQEDMAPRADIGDELRLRVIAGPEEAPGGQRFVVKSLRKRELQRGWRGQVTDDLAHHAVFQLGLGGHPGQMLGDLSGIKRHGHQFLRHRKTGVVAVKG